MMAVTKTQKVVSASENVEKLGPLYTVAGNECGHYGKQMWRFLRKIRNRTTI